MNSSPLFQICPLNLIEVAWLTNEVIDKFESDFKIVAWSFKQYHIRNARLTQHQTAGISSTNIIKMTAYLIICNTIAVTAKISTITTSILTIMRSRASFLT